VLIDMEMPGVSETEDVAADGRVAIGPGAALKAGLEALNQAMIVEDGESVAA